MVKMSYSPEFDQNDPKTFRETLGSFGTTTRPGGNQLQELQTKVRQGVKHVELHLASQGKGEFGALDTPDKYGFQERKTIMQLAKLNNQTLSVHSSLNITSLSGFGQQGFNETQRWESIKEIDESLSFASQTIKSGAVVMHLQGDGGFQSSRGINLSNNYLKWLKEHKPKEYRNIKKDYFKKNTLKTIFVDNPEKEEEIKYDYQNESEVRKKDFEKKHENKIKNGAKPYELFYLENQVEKRKLSPDLNPLVVVGDKITQVERQQEFINFNKLTSSNFDDNEKKTLEKLGIRYGNSITLDDFQKAQATFSNSKPKHVKDVNEKEFNNLQNKLLINYEKVLENNDFMQTQADIDFFKQLNNMQLNMLNLQKKQLDTKYVMFEDELKRVKILERENKEALSQIDKISGNTDKDKAIRDAIKIDIAQRNEDLQRLKHYSIGQEDFHVLNQYDEQIAQINKNKKEVQKQIDNSKSLTDESFERNISALGYLGIKALKHQMNMKQKSIQAKDVIPKLEQEVETLEKQYTKETNREKQDDLAEQISKKRSKLNQWIGTKDYKDIDLVNNPLYIAPENMLPGMGSLTSIEEFKGALRMGQEDFAKKILDDNDENFTQIKKEYEKLTGVKIKTHSDALKLAQRHLAGTFDSAHAGAWLKHFKKENPKESEEHRLERFNKWLNTQAEDMVKEGLVKHIHFNNTTGKDDDHNSISSGILDMHDLRKRLRKAGIKESLIVEIGGRGKDNFHLQSAFQMFNVKTKSYNQKEQGQETQTGTNVSDWVSVKRDYNNRPQYSSYGFNESTFRHNPPQQGQPKGEWSGTGFF